MLTDRYTYSPIIRRNPFRWPNGARIALMVAPNIECFHIDKVIPGAPSAHLPDVTGYALRDYGARIGVFRMMDVLDKHGIRATVLLNSDCARITRRLSKKATNAAGNGSATARPTT